MPVEPGHAARHPVGLPVYIRYRKRRFLAARAHELSTGGVHLAVQSLTLPTGTPVQLEFRGAGRSWLLPAVVVQGASCGIRVMFREPQPELFRDLIESAPCIRCLHRVRSGPDGRARPGNRRASCP